jgi:predicted secreted acid phosphatase
MYKSGERAKIVAAGYRIILNVGDQMSDLNGNPQAELSVKLPNPFYYLP